MGTFPTTTPQFTAAQWADRIGRLFPPGWASEAAKQPGGVFYAITKLFGDQLHFEVGIPFTQSIAVQGAITPSDFIHLHFANKNLLKTVTITYQVQPLDTDVSVASNLARLISSNADLNDLGFFAQAVGTFLDPTTNIVTVNYPITPPKAIWVTGEPPANTTTITATLSTDATETIKITPSPWPGPGSLQYAAAAMRIQTAMGNALDLASLDFLLPPLPRYAGESDDQYRLRIIAALLPTGATRQALSDAIERVTGAVPRIIEPWRPLDTGVWGRFYWNVDTVGTPFRWTDSGMAYQGFVDTILPPLPLLGGNPLPCYDDGFYWGAPGSSFFDFNESVPLGPQAVYDIINWVKVYGTIVWVRFGSHLP